ncbi:TPA: hypothetical protein N0F65_010559 [Lagenidium giganteum]|uniref:Lipoprotein n=1 Tax=Lagenidium giganteum TaxID=4803 RepID=A0AAV2YKJ9_9STRA|nr:TPA: hypothetical protein N0F65_010559 [Lagenidium giganteum]
MAGCGPDETPVSVEGVAGIFCVAGTPCSGDEATGACPLPRYPALPYGAGCGKVATGAYGCKPYTDSSQKTCVGNPAGDIPVSVLGAGTYCTSDPVCAGDQFGNCPGAASGLMQPARCDYVRPGVYGCTVEPPTAQP